MSDNSRKNDFYELNSMYMEVYKHTHQLTVLHTHMHIHVYTHTHTHNVKTTMQCKSNNAVLKQTVKSWEICQICRLKPAFDSIEQLITGCYVQHWEMNPTHS